MITAFAVTAAYDHNAEDSQSASSDAQLGKNDRAKQYSFQTCGHVNKSAHTFGGVSVVVPSFSFVHAGIGSAAAAAAATKHQESADDQDVHAALSHKSQQRRAQKLTKHKMRGKSHLLACLLVCSSGVVWAAILLQKWQDACAAGKRFGYGISGISFSL